MSRRRTTPEKRLHIDKRAGLLLSAAEATIGHNGGPPLDDRMLTTPEAAAFLGCSVQFLEIGRVSGYGPPFVHVTPRMVRYGMQTHLIKWLEQRRDLHARGYAPSRRR